MVLGNRSTATAPPPTTEPASPVDLGFLRLALGIAGVESVRKIKISLEGRSCDLWVLVDHEVARDLERIYLMERDYIRVAGPVPFRLEVVPLDAIPEDRLPNAETLFAR